MKRFNNFSSTTELSAGQQEQASKFNILFIEDENNVDWYDAIKQFGDDTVKIVFDNDGNIISSNKDASMLFPFNYSVAEVAKLPDKFNLFDGWLFKDGKIIKKPVGHVRNATAQKSSLLAEADAIIGPLQEALDLDMAEEGDSEKLTAWRRYRVLLNRVDVTAANIEWPERPE